MGLPDGQVCSINFNGTLLILKYIADSQIYQGDQASEASFPVGPSIGNVQMVEGTFTLVYNEFTLLSKNYGSAWSITPALSD